MAWTGFFTRLGVCFDCRVAGDKPRCTDKLCALIEEKKQQVGNEKLREELLKACQEIPHPIRQIVEQTLEEPSQQ